MPTPSGNFRESLPTSCPPTDATTPTGDERFWRLLKKGGVANADFDSAQHRTKNKEFPDLCRACAVSMVPTLALCKTIVKLARMKHFTHAVEVKFHAACGVFQNDRVEHLSWWVAAACEPMKMLGPVEVLKDKQ